jgi:hypothetical protein
MPPFKVHRSIQRFTRPLGKLFNQTEGIEVDGVAIYCSCSDGKVREVKWDWKLAIAVLGFITHRQGGKLQLHEGQDAYLIQHHNSSPATLSEEKGDRINSEQPEPRPGFKWVERSDRRGEFEEIPIAEESQVCGNAGEDQGM